MKIAQWIIRSQASKELHVTKRYEEGSTTIRVWVEVCLLTNGSLRYSLVPQKIDRKIGYVFRTILNRNVQYHEVKVNIDFESKANLCKDKSGTALTTDLSEASLWVDYIFLDTDERRRFAQLSHEYLIEQLQFTGAESITGTNPRIKLNFNHPCKELVWVIQRDAVLEASASNDWTNFSDSTGVNMVERAKIQLNGHDRFAERPGDVFNLVQPFQHHENVPSNVGINVYSFALKPEEHQPSGTLNMSRIDTAVLALTTKSVGTSAQVKVFAVNYNVLRIMSGELLAAKSYTPNQRIWANRLVASWGRYKAPLARILVVRETPYSPIYQGRAERRSLAKSNELGYGKNDRDWAIRMASTYGRYVKPMVRRQRLNGIRLALKSQTLRASLRYSPSFWETRMVTRWEASPIPTKLSKHKLQYHKQSTSIFFLHHAIVI